MLATSSKNPPVPFRPCTEPDVFSWMSFKTILGYQWKTLVQVEALTAYALFQYAFHPLGPGNLNVEFGQFLLGQCAPAYTQRRGFIKTSNQRLDFGHAKAR